MDNEERKTTDVAVANKKEEIAISANLNSIDLFSDDGIAKAKVFLTNYLKSGKGNYKTIEEGLAIMFKAQELRLPFSSCAEHMYSIGGKPGIDVHIAKALLIKGRVSWDCIEDYRPLYEYTDGINVYSENVLPIDCIKCKSAVDAKEQASKNPEAGIYVYPVKYYKDWQGNLYKDYMLNNGYAIASNTEEAKRIASEKKIPIYRVPAVPIDYVTSYRFYRKIGDRDVVSVGKFSYSEAVAAGLLSKETYIKYLRIMLQNRAFAYGARDIADDLLMGVYTVEELKHINHIPISDTDYEIID